MSEMVYWLADPTLVQQPYETWLSSTMATATVVDKVVRYFRISKQRSKWELDLVLPNRSHFLSFKTKKAAVEFVENYRSDYDDIDNSGYRAACHGGGPGWLRSRPSWIDNCHMMLESNAGGLPKHHSQRERAQAARARFNNSVAQIGSLAVKLNALADATEQQGAPAAATTYDLRKVVADLRKVLDQTPTLIDSAL